MRREDAKKNESIVSFAWHNLIAKRGYFDYWLEEDYQEIEDLICYTYPTISRSFIREIFWKKVKKEKDFLAMYEY